jgi:hypothetical protein
MIQVTRLINIRSLVAESILNFYRAQEAVCEQVPLAPWRDEAKLRASDIYVPMQVWTDKIQFQESPAKPKELKQTRPQWIPSPHRLFQRSPENQNTKSGPDKELEEARYENREPRRIEQREPWEKVFRGTGLRLIFKGGAGSGKSFSLSQEVRRRLSKARTELENFERLLYDLDIPVFIKASALVESDKESIADAVLSALPDLSKPVPSQLTDWWNHAFETERGRRLFIVIDGLDELPETSQSRFRERIRQLDRLEAASLVVSCRTMYFEERRDWVSWAGDHQAKAAEIAPLNEEQQIELIEKLIGPKLSSKEALVGLLKKNYSLSHFCRTPFVLTSACLLYVEGRLSENTSYDSLYKSVTEKMLRGDWRELRQRPKWMRSKSEVRRDAAQQDRTTLLAQICWHLFEASPSENRFTLKQWREAYNKSLGSGHGTKFDATQLLSELELVGMVIDAGYSYHDKCYSFAHRTILEYFAARGLVEQHEEAAWVKILAKHIWCENAWVEVIRFAASLIKNPTSLLHSIAVETGYQSSTPSSLLQGFGKLCDKLRTIIVVFFIGNIIAAIIAFSESMSARSQLETYTSNLRQMLQERFAAASPYDLIGLVNLLLHEFLKLYQLVFQLLYEIARDRGGHRAADYIYYLDWMRFLAPRLAALLAVLWLSSTLISLASKAYYRIRTRRQDDIFRSGLRVQAEIIGQNGNASEGDIKRVVSELLASEQTKSDKIHGAGDDGSLPENLLLLLGSNAKARRELNTHWLASVNQRSKQIRRRNRWHQRSLSIYRCLLSKARKEDDPSLLAKTQRILLRFSRWWVRRKLYLSMWALRDVEKGSELFRALRGIALIPDARAKEPLKELLEQNAEMTRRLLDAEKTERTFTNLDIYTAKALANAGDLYGKERLTEFANRLDEKNQNTPLAIKELSMFDETRAIELAAACIKDEWRSESLYYYISEREFMEILHGLPYERVTAELSRLSVEDKGYFRKVLLQYLLQGGHEVTKEWMQKAASGNVHPALTDEARDVLGKPVNKYWADDEGWIGELTDNMKSLLDKQDFGGATKYFAELFDYYKWQGTLQALLNNPEKISLLCNQRLLDGWFVKSGGRHSMYKELALLAKDPHGDVVKKSLINWASNGTVPKGEDDEDGYFWKRSLFLALGDIGDEEAEAALLKILRKARQRTNPLWLKIAGAKYDLSLLVALSKTGRDEALREIQREFKHRRTWITYYILARLLAERDDPRALELLLIGKSKRGSETWDKEFGPEPELRDFALRFGARISLVKVDEKGSCDYVAVSQSRDFKYRVRA